MEFQPSEIEVVRSILNHVSFQLMFDPSIPLLSLVGGALALLSGFLSLFS